MVIGCVVCWGGSGVFIAVRFDTIFGSTTINLSATDLNPTERATEPDTLLRARLTSRLKALIFTSLHGQPVSLASTPRTRRTTSFDPFPAFLAATFFATLGRSVVGGMGLGLGLGEMG